MPAMTTHGGVLYYVVKIPKEHNDSVESGWDNPFRPGGDLSREADEIVELIKGGKPITPTPGQQAPSPTLPNDEYQISNNIQDTPIPAKDVAQKKTAVTQLKSSPAQNNANGTTKEAVTKPSSPGAVDVQRGTVKPDGDASQVEHVTIKKKPKCKCCVIQ